MTGTAIATPTPPRTAGFAAHAGLALAGLAILHLLLARYVPFSIQQIGSSYQIFFYHFASAINTFLLYTVVLVASIAYLSTQRPRWDRIAHATCEVGVLANAILLVTGSTWAKAAWNTWWVWDDPRLMTAAVMSLTYLGYLVLQNTIETPERRRTYAAVLGILAFLNIPIVHFSIRTLGETSHPLRLSSLSDPEIRLTRWFGVLAFLVFFTLLCRWEYARRAALEEVEDALTDVRRIEEERAR